MTTCCSTHLRLRPHDRIGSHCNRAELMSDTALATIRFCLDLKEIFTYCLGSNQPYSGGCTLFEQLARWWWYDGPSFRGPTPPNSASVHCLHLLPYLPATPHPITFLCTLKGPIRGISKNGRHVAVGNFRGVPFPLQPL